jgi:hypothetical protein
LTTRAAEGSWKIAFTPRTRMNATGTRENRFHTSFRQKRLS